MATFEPDIELFRAQIDSLRAQTDADWVCLISDDCSAPEHFERIERDGRGDDPRFVVSRSRAAAGLLPQLRAGARAGPAEARAAWRCATRTTAGTPRSSRRCAARWAARSSSTRTSAWSTPTGACCARRSGAGGATTTPNLASLLIANTITGAATLFRREVAELALPFPTPRAGSSTTTGSALVALAAGDVAYVDRPLYDYVQHAGAIFGDVTAGPRRGRRRRRRLAAGGSARLARGLLLRLPARARCRPRRCWPAAPSRLTARKRRALERFVARRALAAAAFAWLAARPLRALAGRNETLGTESRARARHPLAIAGRGARAAAPRTPGGAPLDATLSRRSTPADLESERGSPRWRARL